MKTNQLSYGLAVLVLALARTAGQAEEVAVVKENHVNVRGQPSLVGEVITQLQKGDKVVVLEQVPVEKPKKGEPAKWARIQMPANTPVWVFASFIDPNNKSVTATRVNLRAGPGENFSVVGRLERGDTVKEIRKVEDWMEIETPDKAHAFIAVEFLSKLDTTPAPALAKSEKVGTAAEPLKTEPPRILPPNEAAKPENIPAVASDQRPPGTAPSFTGQPSSQPPAQVFPALPTSSPETAPAAANVVSTSSVPAPATPQPNAAATPALLTQNTTATPAPIVSTSNQAERPPAESGPPPKRIVRREGVVRSTKSIQAPTYFELTSLDTRKAMDFLDTLDPELKLKDYKGRKIVVTGEEGIDSRWPNVPILEIETIELAP